MKADCRMTVIRPPAGPGTWALSLAWRRRAFLGALTLEFMRRLYRNTLMGWVWILLRPLVPAVLTMVVLGKIAKVPTDGVPYPVFVLAGLSIWGLFASSFRLVTRSLGIGRRYASADGFPRVLVPVACLSFFLIEFAIYTLLLLGALVFFALKDGVLHAEFSPRLLAAPAFVVSMLLFTLGAGFFTSILNTRKRDVQFTVPYAVGLAFFFSPVAYPLSAVPEPLRGIMLFNPLTGLLEGYRWALFGGAGVLPWNLFYAMLVCLAVFSAGLRFFLKSEPLLPDSK